MSLLCCRVVGRVRWRLDYPPLTGYERIIGCYRGVVEYPLRRFPRSTGAQSTPSDVLQLCCSQSPLSIHCVRTQEMLGFWLQDGGELRHSSRQGWTPTPTLRIAVCRGRDEYSTRKDSRWPRVPDMVQDACRRGGHRSPQDHRPGAPRRHPVGGLTPVHSGGSDWPRGHAASACRLGGAVDSYQDLKSQTEEIADARIRRRGRAGAGPQLR